MHLCFLNAAHPCSSVSKRTNASPVAFPKLFLTIRIPASPLNTGASSSKNSIYGCDTNMSINEIARSQQTSYNSQNNKIITLFSLKKSKTCFSNYKHHVSTYKTGSYKSRNTSLVN